MVTGCRGWICGPHVHVTPANKVEVKELELIYIFLTLHNGLYYCKVAGIISYSGSATPPLRLQKPYVTPVLLVHGDQGRAVPFGCLEMSIKLLKALDIPVESYVCQGLDHSIDEKGQKRSQKGVEFLKKVLAFQGRTQEKF